MKNFAKFLLISTIMVSTVVNNSYAMDGDEPGKRSNYVSVKLDNPDVYELESSAPIVSMSIEEGRDTRSVGTRLKGYGTRCAVIGCTTLIGGAIGFGVMAGIYDVGTAYELVRYTTPVFVGAAIGYSVGWGCGNAAKFKISGRC